MVTPATPVAQGLVTKVLLLRWCIKHLTAVVAGVAAAPQRMVATVGPEAAEAEPLSPLRLTAALAVLALAAVVIRALVALAAVVAATALAVFALAQAATAQAAQAL